MNESISTYLTDDHHRCDQLLARCEGAIQGGDWKAAEAAATALREAMLRHFTLEEEILFPDIEAANPMASGPTGVMRVEHGQMRGLLGDLDGAVTDQDTENGLGSLETLHFLVQQHNAKEEGILYPLADQALAGSAASVVARLQGR